MTESEKVIKALECCEDIHRAGRWASGCIACPYAETEEKIERCDLQLLKDAAALLKEQEPPTSEELKAHYGKMYKCEGCGLEWYQQTQRYCQHCGRAVSFK